MRDRNILRAYRRLPFGVKHSARRVIDAMQPHRSYGWWIRFCEQRADASLAAKEIAGFAYGPKVSIVMPTYNSSIELLDLAIESMRRQFYQNWELCICDDASPRAEVRDRLKHWSEREPRIKTVFLEKNEGIGGASNNALKLATGEFVGLLDHDDELTPDALFEVVKLLQENRDADIIYSDEDKLTPVGKRIQPFFKPDWSPEFMLCVMYTCHFTTYRRRVVEELQGFRPEFAGSQDYDLFLRAAERTDRIYHIPKILYHWRMAPGSVANSANSKPYAFEAAKRAITEHLERRGIPGKAVHGPWPGAYRLRFEMDGRDKVSIGVFGHGDQQKVNRCLKSVQERSSYANREIISGERDENSSSNLSRRINKLVSRASGNYIVLLDEDTEVVSTDWIEAMLGFFRLNDVGAVGAKLTDRNGRIQHIGIALGLKGVAGYPLRGLYGYPFVFPDPNDFFRNCSAVSAACMMVRKEAFQRIGGFDEKLPSLYNDVDFCLRLRRAGYRIVWTPDARLECEAARNGDGYHRDAAEYLEQRWGVALRQDPYYNPNLTLKYADMGFRT